MWNWVPYSIHEVTHLRTWQEEGLERGSLKEVFDVYSLTEDVRMVGSKRLRWDGRRQAVGNFEWYEFYGYGKLSPEPR